jgi:membrane-bound ClpP family serine protease
MSRDRRGLNLGIILVAVGGYLVLQRELSFRGPAPILLLIGTILLAFSSLRAWRGPNVPAGVLLGLGLAFALRDRLVDYMPHWVLMLFGIGFGLLFAAALERAGGRAARPGPLVPGVVLVTIAVLATLSENLHVPESFADALWRLWPWVIVAAGVALVVRALAMRKSS